MNRAKIMLTLIAAEVLFDALEKLNQNKDIFSSAEVSEVLKAWREYKNILVS